MPLDGITLNSVVQELSILAGGRVDKVQQPEKDEIVMAIRSRGENHKLLLAANANSPRIHLTKFSKANPSVAPMFCMLLRKHCAGGRIIKIIQPDFERIVEIFIESPNEMGDMSTKRLVIEIMGKHSNIILVNAAGIIMDSIRHIPKELSSVREVMPGREYTRPPSHGKRAPVPTDREYFMSLFDKNMMTQQMIYKSYNGVSPVVGTEICLRAGIDTDAFPENLPASDRERLFLAFSALYEDVNAGRFDCRIYENHKRDFSAIFLSLYPTKSEPFDSPSAMLELYYHRQDTHYRLTQKTTDLRKLVQNHFDRCCRKREIHQGDIHKTANREQLRHYGELITAFIHTIPKKTDRVVLPDFYNNNTKIEIPLDPELTPAENAQKYFKGYNKAKRAYIALQEQTKANEEDITYLDSVLAAITSVTDESDIAEIRAELALTGFLKKRHQNSKKNQQKKSEPLHYRSTDGFDIYVGKNNTQNDELTLRFARPADIWLHSKEIAGSHVIISGGGRQIPDQTILEGAKIAAYHSKARAGGQVPVDYCPRKNVRKPKNAKPGFVIYDFYNTVYVTPHQEEIEKLATVR